MLRLRGPRTILGRRKRVIRRKRHTGGIIGHVAKALLGFRRKKRIASKSIGYRRKRPVKRGGFLGSILKGVHSIAKAVPIASTVLNATGNPLLGKVASTLGYRRKRVVRRGGFKTRGMTHFGGFKVHGNTRFGGIRRLKRPLLTSHVIRKSGMRRKRMVGRGILDTLKGLAGKAHDLIKSNQLVSKGLSLIPHKFAAPASSLASSLGYRRVRRGGLRHRLTRRGGMKLMPNVMYF